MLWIVTATRWEARPLGERLGLRLGAPGRLGGRDALLLETGMGAEAARAALESARRSGPAPDALLHVGFAGACQPGVAPGTLLFDVWGEESALRELAKEVAAGLGLPFQLGRVASAPRVLTTPEQKAAFGRERRALAADLENEAVRGWARGRGVASMTAKVVLDALEQDLPGEAPAPGAAAGAAYVAAHWRELPALLRLWRQQRRGVDRLARFLAGFVPRLPVGAAP